LSPTSYPRILLLTLLLALFRTLVDGAAADTSLTLLPSPPPSTTNANNRSEPTERPDTAPETAAQTPFTASSYLPLVSGAPSLERYLADNRAFELDLLRLINLERATVGLPPLRENTTLTQAARRHADDMITHQSSSHFGSDGTHPYTRMTQEGYTGTPWTEATGIGPDTPASIIASWMASSRHRDIVLDRTAGDIGLGYAHDGLQLYQHTWVIDLGASEAVASWEEQRTR
jgi:uncharacterized protein YkwD